MTNQAKVLLIYTGGTIGMHRNPHTGALEPFDFEQTYGEIGKGFIHVHHLTPVSSIGKEYRLNPQTDLVPVCPNCHNMLHRKEPPYTIAELQGKYNS